MAKNLTCLNVDYQKEACFKQTLLVLKKTSNRVLRARLIRNYTILVLADGYPYYIFFKLDCLALNTANVRYNIITD